MATRWARVARGLTAASFAVFVTAFAHVAGGGQLPSFAGFALAFAFAALACIALAGRRISRVRVAASVILSQGALHLLFLLTGGGHGATTIPAMGMHMHMPGASTSIQLAAAPATASMYTSGWMWLAHGAAALLTIVALLWGEKAFWGVYETARLALVRALRVARLRPPTRAISLPRVFTVAPYRRSARFLLAGLRHRGPPSGVTASA